MEIQTVDELCEEIADMVGIYSCCKNQEDGCYDTNPRCCRTGFIMVLKDKMRKAVEFEDSVLVEVTTMPMTDWESTDYREQYLKEIINYKHE